MKRKTVRASFKYLQLGYKVAKEFLVVYVLLWAAAIAPDFAYNERFMTFINHLFMQEMQQLPNEHSKN